MALVNYGSSDSEEDNELDLPEEREPNNRVDTSDKNETKSAIQDEFSSRSEGNRAESSRSESNRPDSTRPETIRSDSSRPESSRSLGNQSDDDDLRTTSHLKLPQPSADSKAKTLIGNLSASRVNGKVKIFLPSFKGAAEDDEYKEPDDDEREFKRFKYSSSRGSGLKSLLPPPKNQIKTSAAKAASFVPDVLKRRAEQSRPSTSKSSSSVRAEDEDDESVNFFSFDQTVKSSASGDLKPSVQPVMPNRFETDLIKSKFGDASIRQVSSQTAAAKQPAGVGQETEYQKELKLKYEIEKQFKDEAGDQIKIQEVNIANHLNDNLDYIKSVSEERQQEVSGPLPSMMAKRKHQITYLAFQAKQNELKLKNEWAQGRANRDQARSKYGF